MAFFIGALLPTFLISRFLLFILKKWDTKYKKLLFAHAISLLIATVIGGMGMADGGAFAAVQAFGAYLLPQALWLAVDAVLLRRKLAKSKGK